jgi:branched-chain amino acid transport system ATP-binding protein
MTAVPTGRAQPSGPTNGDLVVEGVTVAFGGLSVLHQVSLVASRGEVVGVIGPNGAGKTTLFNVICRFVRPSAGRVLWRGRDLRRQRPHDLAHLGIARSLQGVGLFSGLSVLENVMTGAQVAAKAGFVASTLGLARSSREERRLTAVAMAALDRLGVAEFAARMPATLPYPVQKRTALARVLASSPDLLLLDEPASGLSAAELEDLKVLLRSLRDETGIMLVEHNMDLVMATCDRIVALDFGKVIATGTPAEIRTNADVATAYLGDVVPETEPAGGSDARH